MDNSSIWDRFEEVDQQPKKLELKSEAKARLKREKVIEHIVKQKVEIKTYNPDKDKKVKGEAHKTIFVGKLSYKTDERKLEDTFLRFGDIKRVRIIRDPETNKSKGYGFVEF